MPGNTSAADIVLVEFFEDGAGSPFAVSNVPIDQLPDTFEIQTTMNLGAEDWTVVAAEPAQKAEFRDSGKLKLYLTKVDTQSVDPSEILYSLPKINARLPDVEDAASLEGVVVYREDDWRQFEFIDARHGSAVEEELSSIHVIYDEYREGSGFRAIHLRQKIEDPLSIRALTLNTLADRFEIAGASAGVAFDTAPAKISDGFALLTETGWILWGQADESGMILVLNLYPTEEAVMAGFSERVDTLMKTHGLYAVDWTQMFRSGPTDRPFSSYANVLGKAAPTARR